MSTDSQGIEPATSDTSELAALSVSGSVVPDTVREVRPFTILGGKDDPTLDFRPLSVNSSVEEEASDPKDSSAPGSVGSSSSRAIETTELPSESNASQDETASAGKDSGKPKDDDKNGTPIF